jgi:hypothetical protein
VWTVILLYKGAVYIKDRWFQHIMVAMRVPQSARLAHKPSIWSMSCCWRHIGLRALQRTGRELVALLLCTGGGVTV